jgi:hypothetical protein
MKKNYRPEIVFAHSIFEAFHCLIKAFNETYSNETTPEVSSPKIVSSKKNETVNAENSEKKGKLRTLNPEIDD